MTTLYLLFLYLKQQLILLLKFFNNLRHISSISKITYQELELPINIRKNNGEIYFNGKSKLGKKSSYLLLDNGKEIIIKNGCNIGKNASIISYGSLTVGNNAIINDKSLILSKANKVIIGTGLKIGNNANLIINRDINIGNNFILGQNTIINIANDYSIKNNVSIASNVHISPREPNFSGEVYLGEGSQIGPNTIIDTCDNFTLDKGAIIGPNCVIYTHNHDYLKANNKPLGKAQAICGPVSIGENTWIGTNVIILPNVNIGKNVVISAGAVVTKSIPDKCMAGGVPAKIIKQINE